MPTEEERRYMRDYQAKRRGSRSYKSEMEDLQKQVLLLQTALAWEAGEITEGTAARLMGTDRVSARAFKQESIARGIGYETWDAMQQDREKQGKSWKGVEPE